MLTVPEPQIPGKRRAPRYSLGGIVELTDLDSGRMKVGVVRTPSLYGCFVKTEMPVVLRHDSIGLTERSNSREIDFRLVPSCNLLRLEQRRVLLYATVTIRTYDVVMRVQGR